MRFGYIRISGKKQTYDRQRDAVEKAGVNPLQIFEETYTGMKMKRPVFEKLLEKLRPGDEIVVDDLARLGRNRDELFLTIENLSQQKIRITCIFQPYIKFDETDATGKLFLNLMLDINEFYREFHREQTMRGLEAATKRGKRAGRPIGATSESLEAYKNVIALMSANRDLKLKDALKIAKLPSATYYRIRKVVIVTKR